jgi:hypothetical protein
LQLVIMRREEASRRNGSLEGGCPYSEWTVILEPGLASGSKTASTKRMMMHLPLQTVGLAREASEHMLHLVMK